MTSNNELRLSADLRLDAMRECALQLEREGWLKPKQCAQILLALPLTSVEYGDLLRFRSEREV